VKFNPDHGFFKAAISLVAVNNHRDGNKVTGHKEETRWHRQALFGWKRGKCTNIRVEYVMIRQIKRTTFV
jgi:hypothetical protein